MAKRNVEVSSDDDIEDIVDEESAVEEVVAEPAESDTGNVDSVRRIVYRRKPNGQLVVDDSA